MVKHCTIDCERRDRHAVCLMPMSDSNEVPWWYLDFAFPDSTGIFSYSDWSRHRSWLRFWWEPGTFLRALGNMLPILVWVTLVTICMTLYYELGQMQHEGWVVLVSKDYNQPFILTSFALALLLVFRTNSSYERWWSARKHFGQMYNDARSLARFTMVWIAPKEPVVAARMMRFLSVLGPASCSYMREDGMRIFDSLVGCTLVDKEYDAIKQSEQPPITILMLLSHWMKETSCLQTFERITMEERLVSYQIELGCLERIKNQPIYTPYTRQTSRFLLIYLTFLPFSLIAYLSWASIGVMPMLVFLLVGIDNIGIRAENPMTTLPIKALAASSKNTVEVIWRTYDSMYYKNIISS